MWSFRNYLEPFEEDLVGQYAVRSLLEDSTGTVWVSSSTGCLWRWNGSPLQKHQQLNAILWSNLCLDQNGRLWLGSYGNGLYCYDATRFRIFRRDQGLPGDDVYCLTEGRDGRLWIGTGKGVVQYTDAEFHPVDLGRNLDERGVRVLLVDGEDRLWIGGNWFIAFCEEGALHTVREKPSGSVSLVEDREGRMWFGTEGGGVACYDEQVMQHIQIPGEPAFNLIHTIYVDSKNRIWFGTDAGLVQYKPQQRAPEVAVEVIADRTYEAVGSVEIPTTAGRLSFCFRSKSAIDHISHLVYRYRLEAYDADWQQTRERQVDYPPLTPGEYRFQVQAVDADLNYSETATVAVKITPDPRLEGLTEVLRTGNTPHEFIGESPVLYQVQQQLAQVAPTDLTVLILGETGTGKGLAARSVHALSPYKSGPFIQVNCGAMPEGLVESELFGHEKGAFTGATERKLGKVELAQDGTLFLDEIGDLALEAQVKLLRLLEEQTFEHVGGTQTLTADARVIAATNRDLAQMVTAGTFREDLLFRLQVFPVQLPPLRQRRQDILLLATYFMERMAVHLHKEVSQLTPAAQAALRAYDWPGNVRELEHTIQRAVVVCRSGAIQGEDISLDLGSSRAGAVEEWVPLETHERRYILQVLEQTGWVISGADGAATILGLHEATLRSRMRKLGIKRPPR